MDINTVYAKLNVIFRDLFDDDSIVVTPQTTANDIEDWDSLEHITLDCYRRASSSTEVQNGGDFFHEERRSDGKHHSGAHQAVSITPALD